MLNRENLTSEAFDTILAGSTLNADGATGRELDSRNAPTHLPSFPGFNKSSLVRSAKVFNPVQITIQWKVIDLVGPLLTCLG